MYHKHKLNLIEQIIYCMNILIKYFANMSLYKRIQNILIKNNIVALTF